MHQRIKFIEYVERQGKPNQFETSIRKQQNCQKTDRKENGRCFDQTGKKTVGVSIRPERKRYVFRSNKR